MVFQDSYSSLNPRLPVALSIAFGPMVQGLPKAEALSRALGILEQVGLDPATFAGRYSHELSGGQRQRVNIAPAPAPIGRASSRERVCQYGSHSEVPVSFKKKN